MDMLQNSKIHFNSPKTERKIETQSLGLSEVTHVSEILQAVKGMRYGSVEIIIHDSKVVQIERKEKIRFEK